MTFSADIFRDEKLLVVRTVRLMTAYTGHHLARVVRISHLVHHAGSFRVGHLHHGGRARVHDAADRVDLLPGRGGHMSAVFFVYMAGKAERLYFIRKKRRIIPDMRQVTCLASH